MLAKRVQTMDKIKEMLDTPMEKWAEQGVVLKAVSANADGRVNSGITKDGIYFWRRSEYTLQNGYPFYTGKEEFVIGG